MEPSLPAWQPGEPQQNGPAYDIGDFEQGSPLSRWALARYVVGRVILERVSLTLLVLAGGLGLLAVLAQVTLHSTFLTVVLLVLVGAVLLMRWGLRAVLNRLMGAKAYGPLEQRLGAVVDGARSDVFAELRRVGLPSRVLTLPLIAVRLAGRRRQETLGRIREFEAERAVSRARVDELHLVLRAATGSAVPPRRVA